MLLWTSKGRPRGIGFAINNFLLEGSQRRRGSDLYLDFKVKTSRNWTDIVHFYPRGHLEMKRVGSGSKREKIRDRRDLPKEEVIKKSGF